MESENQDGYETAPLRTHTTVGGWSALRRQSFRGSQLVAPLASQRTFCEVVRSGNLGQVKAALKASPALANSFDPLGVPVLVVAIEEELPSITRMLVRAGANPVAKCRDPERDGATPLSISLLRNRPFITRILIERFLFDQYFEKHEFLSTRELEAHFDDARDKIVVRRTLVEICACTRLAPL